MNYMDAVIALLAFLNGAMWTLAVCTALERRRLQREIRKMRRQLKEIGDKR